MIRRLIQFFSSGISAKQELSVTPDEIIPLFVGIEPTPHVYWGTLAGVPCGCLLGVLAAAECGEDYTRGATWKAFEYLEDVGYNRAYLDGLEDGFWLLSGVNELNDPDGPDSPRYQEGYLTGRTVAEYFKAKRDDVHVA